MTTFQKIIYVLLGMMLAVGIFCLAVWIGCSVNNISFSQQIINWFGATTPAVDEIAKTAIIKPLI